MAYFLATLNIAVNCSAVIYKTLLEAFTEVLIIFFVSSDTSITSAGSTLLEIKEPRNYNPLESTLPANFNPEPNVFDVSISSS